MFLVAKHIFILSPPCKSNNINIDAYFDEHLGLGNTPNLSILWAGQKKVWLFRAKMVFPMTVPLSVLGLFFGARHRPSPSLDERSRNLKLK